MPITDTLKTAEELRRTGFTQDQSSLLAQKFEETAQAVGQDLKGFLRAELGAIRAEFGAMEVRLDARLAELRLEIESRFAELRLEIEKVRSELQAGLRNQMVKFVTILVAVVSIAVAIIKLFPNFP